MVIYISSIHPNPQHQQCHHQKDPTFPLNPTDLRSPCPLINSLANHGYIPHTGREIHLFELQSALDKAGLSPSLNSVFSDPIFLQRRPNKNHSDPVAKSSLWENVVVYLIKNPYALVSAAVGMRKPGARRMAKVRVFWIWISSAPMACIIEHNVSLTRRDSKQGDNATIQKDLVEDLLASTTDGKEFNWEFLSVRVGFVLL